MRRRTAFDKEKETETMADLRKAFDTACQHLVSVAGKLIITRIIMLISRITKQNNLIKERRQKVRNYYLDAFKIK